MFGHTYVVAGRVEQGVDLLDRGKVAFENQDGETMVLPLHQISEAVRLGTITRNHKVFNNTVGRISELEDSWIVPVTESWTRKYFG